MNFNRNATDPDLKDVFDLLKKETMLATNCHAIGTIKSFDPATQTATAIVNYCKTYFEKNAAGQYVPINVEYPPMVKCPVICLSGGSVALTMPIAEGDTCMVLFNDRDIDNWFKGANSGPVATGRLHGFADAIILVGVRSLANVLPSYNTTQAQISDGTSKLKIGTGTASIENGAAIVQAKTKIKVANAATDLLTVINGLIDILSTGFSGPTQTPGNPINPTAQAALTAYKTTVMSLLE